MNKEEFIKDISTNRILKGISTNNELVSKIIESIKDLPKNITAENFIRVILLATPTGNLIDLLIFQNKDKKEIEQIKKLLNNLSLRYNDLNNEKLDEDYIMSEEFYIVFKRILERVKFEHRDEKICLYGSFLFNCTIKSQIGVNKDYLLKKLDLIEIEHFKIMKFYLENNFNRPSAVGSDYDNNKKIFQKTINSYYHVYETDLVNFGFLIEIDNPNSTKRYYLSDLGIEFLNFIKYESS